MGVISRALGVRIAGASVLSAACVVAVVVPGSAAGATGTATVRNTSVASGSAGTASSGPSTPHAQAVCPRPTRHHASCLAMRLVGRTSPRALPRGVTRAYTVGPSGGYTPATLAKAYGITPSAATTQTVAIVDAYQDPNIRADLNTFDAQYGLPAETATSLQIVSQTGGSASAVPLDTTGWSIEQALDVQAVRAVCAKCKILLVQANSNNDANLGAAENYAAAHAFIVTNSFGEPETGAAPSAAQAYNHPGVAILASTGDDGWYDWDHMNKTADRGPSSNAPQSPASLNTVIAVAGTSLYLNADGTRAAEDVWNDNGPSDNWGFYLGARLGASGGGCSTAVPAQAWQAKVAGYSTLGCGTKRSTTDIAALADPLTGFDVYSSYVYASGVTAGWATIGGTSLASPLVAGMMGLAGGPHGVKYPALTLYGHYKSARATYDVTVGGTGACSTSTPLYCQLSYGKNPNTFYAGGYQIDCAFGTDASTAVLANRYQCYANKGYDGVSGVGTPAGLKTFAALKPAASIANPGTVTHKVTKVFNGAGSTDPFPGGAITSYAWNFGDGHTGTGAKPAHKYTTAKKTYTVTLTVKDNYGFSGAVTRKVTTK